VRDHGSPVRAGRRKQVGPVFVMLVVLASLLLAARVWSEAWVSEDAFITFRYVTNVLEGHGAVFNPGEQVQGYTHPLWFIALTLASVPYRDPVIVSTVLSLLLTVALVAVVGRALWVRAHDTLRSVSLLALLCLSWAASRSWVLFQTSGLENSLSNLLLAVLVVQLWTPRTVRPRGLGLTLALLVLTRPDFLLIVVPVAVAYALRNRGIGDLARFAAGLSPALLWAGFAWLYYGTIVPNTAHAKMGLWSSWRDGVAQGLAYVADFASHEPASAAAATVLLGAACRRSRESLRWAAVAGVVLYALYIVWIGGDFMRGRMFLPVFSAAGLAGVLALNRPACFGRAVSIGLAATLTFLLALQSWFAEPPSAVVSEAGIVDEQAYYPGYRLDAYLERGRVVSPYLNLDFADQLRAFARRCGPVTIHARNPGTIGYLAGAEVSVIDTLGLTDAFIARLPRSELVADRPRPGHPDKSIPISYLAARRDVSILPGWESAIVGLDCSVVDRAAVLVDSNRLWVPR